MTVDIPRHLRIANADLTDDYVDKRTRSIDDIAGTMRTQADRGAVLALASDVVATFRSERIHAPQSLRDSIVAAITANAKSFVGDGEADVELGVVCLLAAAKALEEPPEAKPESDLFARCLALGLDFAAQRPEERIEVLRRDLLSRASKAVELKAEQARERKSLKPYPQQAADEEEEDFNVRWSNYQSESLGYLERNALLDREELNVLWWTLGAWSGLLGVRLAEAEPRAAALAAGVELAAIVVGAPAEAHRHLVLRNLPQTAAPCGLSSFSGVNRELLDAVTKRTDRHGAIIDANPRILPLLWVVRQTSKGRFEPAELDRIPLSKGDRALRYWASRALDEAALLSTLE